MTISSRYPGIQKSHTKNKDFWTSDGKHHEKNNDFYIMLHHNDPIGNDYSATRPGITKKRTRNTKPIRRGCVEHAHEYGFGMIPYGLGKLSINMFRSFWPCFDISWYFWPQNMKIHIQKIHVASTRTSGSPFLGLKLQFFIFMFPNIRPEFRTSSKIWHGLEYEFDCFFIGFWIWAFWIHIKSTFKIIFKSILESY